MKTYHAGRIAVGNAWVLLALTFIPATKADLFVSSQTAPAANSILRYDGATGDFLGVAAAEEGLVGPLGMSFGPDGNLYVASANNNQIRRYHGTTGASLGVFASGGGLQAPINLTFGPDGHLYVSSSYNQILRFDGSTGAFMDAFVTDPRLAYPRGLKFGHDGHLYVVSYNTAQVLRYDGTSGAFIDTFVTARSGGLFTPSDLAFGPDGNLYVTGGTFPEPGVFRYDGSTGAFMDKFATVPVRNRMAPVNMAFGPDANLYVVTQSAVFSVLRFDGSNGSFMDYFVPDMSGGLSNPFGIAFSPDNAPVIVCSPPAPIPCPGAVEITSSVFDLDGDPLKVEWHINGQSVETNNVPPSNPPLAHAVSLMVELAAGENLVEVWVDDGTGQAASCATVILIEDTTPPEIVAASASPKILWPPNHRMVKVKVEAEVTDNCDGATWRITGVRSNERQDPPDRRRGPYFRRPLDWIITGPDTVWLRSERSGPGHGRIYSIIVQAEDSSGNHSEPAVITVRAPKNARELRDLKPDKPGTVPPRRNKEGVHNN